MSPFIENSNLTIIALRILPRCESHIKKCLKENVFYYLNTNYEIKGDIIKIRNEYVDIIDDNFFDLKDGESSPNISISAIVGKNGDGKSSLIEFMIRLINNFACKKGLNPNNHLVYVKGLSGELYYRQNERIFRVRINGGEKDPESSQMHEYKWDDVDNEYKIDRKQLLDIEIHGNTFYTLVSNYSHFAYNTEEFEKEDAPDEIGGHWLKKVFHKNDAYQTPLNIHPYREKGNIDINRERLLSMQRLLVSIASSLTKGTNSDYRTAVDINDKTPYILRLNDIGYSKLQEHTLKKYFEDNRNTNIIESQVEVLKEYISKDDDLSGQNAFICDITGTFLSRLRKDYIHKPLLRYFKDAIGWIERNKLEVRNSDLAQIIDRIDKSNDDDTCEYMSNTDLSIWQRLKYLSAKQFLRFSLVYDICTMWNKVGIDKSTRLSFDPTSIFKPYDSLSNAEKCCQYIIYKTIEVFATYPSYGDPINNYDSKEFFFSYSKSESAKYTLFNLDQAFQRLSIDWQKKSHTTLKLRQAYSFLRGCNSSNKLYASVSKHSGKSISFEDLAPRYIKTLSNIESLPPPIFKWEIIYHKNNTSEIIPFSSFSSGEKQKLFFQSAVIYHLRNLNSIGEEPIHYPAVNLVFEEIELYFHPEWQRTLIYDLMQSIRNANIPEIYYINMIFVTHSPYILSDIPKSNVLFLKEGMPVYEMQENTFGANINSLLKNGFFLPSLPMGEFAYRKINTIFEKLHSGQFNPQDLHQIYAQIMTIGEPAIRAQLMSLLTPYRKLFFS